MERLAWHLGLPVNDLSMNSETACVETVSSHMACSADLQDSNRGPSPEFTARFMLLQWFGM